MAWLRAARRVFAGGQVLSASEILGRSGPLARALGGYEERREQLAMAELVEQALEREAVALIEAGTGTGKTLAYLVPALLSGKKVVISTGTKTLQEQIVHRDLPLLARHLEVPVEAAMMKGLGNYLCLRRFGELLAAPEVERPWVARSLSVLREFRLRSESGERADLALPEDAPIWSEVQSGSDTRIGARCQYYESCFVTRMRRAAEDAQIVVVNHHLFFADLALRGPHGGSAIPDYDAVIFDEAHQIEGVVTEFFGVRVSTARIEALIRDTERAFRAVGMQDVVASLCSATLATTSDFFASLPSGPSPDAGRRSLPLDVLDGGHHPELARLDAALEALYGEAKLRVHLSEPIVQIAKRIDRVRDDLTVLARARASHVLWSEARGRHVALGASPVEVGDVLRERMFDRGGAAVFTSATLTTGSDKKAGDAAGFSFFRQRLGIDFPTLDLSVASPFDYPAQAALYLPTDFPEPRDPHFAERAADEIVSLIALTGGGAFVLCTSLRSMQRLHSLCAPRLAHPPLIQGMAPKGELLERFKARGDAVLFASASFWEGVDVPGSALRLVIIDKLPFEVPSDPLVQARCERLEARGGSPFMQYLVPSAALALKQGFGRLIRTRSDRGIVAVLDRRLTSKGYGRVLLRSLPDASRCYSLAEVAAFWQT